MAKGAIAKTEFFTKLQEIYPNSFFDNKVLRIPFMEEGNLIELKISAVCAKDVIGGGATSEVAATANGGGYDFEAPAQTVNTAAMTEPTQEEKDNVAALLKALF